MLRCCVVRFWLFRSGLSVPYLCTSGLPSRFFWVGVTGRSRFGGSCAFSLRLFGCPNLGRSRSLGGCGSWPGLSSPPFGSFLGDACGRFLPASGRVLQFPVVRPVVPGRTWVVFFRRAAACVVVFVRPRRSVRCRACFVALDPVRGSCLLLRGVRCGCAACPVLASRSLTAPPFPRVYLSLPPAGGRPPFFPWTPCVFFRTTDCARGYHCQPCPRWCSPGLPSAGR